MSSQLLLLLAITIVNLGVAQVRMAKTAARETRRLRLALATELEQLGKLQLRNLASLKGGKKVVLSSRSCMVVYKSSLGRLVSIPDDALQDLVRAYSVIEQTEHMIASTAKANSPSFYRLQDDQRVVDEIVQELEVAEVAIKTAIVSIRSAARTVPVTPDR